MEDLIKLEAERFAWSLKIFPEATPLSSLKKLQSEIKEIEVDLTLGRRNPEEYADALMCLLDSAGRRGIGLREIVVAFSNKLEKNKKRGWRKNEDSTYSHVNDKPAAKFELQSLSDIDLTTKEGQALFGALVLITISPGMIQVNAAQMISGINLEPDAALLYCQAAYERSQG